MPNLYVMVGLPGSGKSTMINDLKKTMDNPYVYSTDDTIEKWAKDQGRTYDFAFSKYIKQATIESDIGLGLALSAQNDIIWDQTNLTKKKRKSIITRVGKNYNKICYYIAPPKNKMEEDILVERLNSRAGKTIPNYVFNNMKNSYEEPCMDEGFDKVIHVSLIDTKNILEIKNV